MSEIKILTTEASNDYELIDSGDGEKLERFGRYVLRRPDPQALWRKNLEEKEWKEKAHASFVREGDSGKWRKKDGVPSEWFTEMLDGKLKFLIKPTAFKHTGLFPENEPNWVWVQEKITRLRSETPARQVKVLNLFGYTGGATLAAAQAGATAFAGTASASQVEVTHVDGSKSAITWARQNAEASKLADCPVRWIEDDARKFVQREIKRGNKYDAIIMDPPAFGHGAKNEVWKIEEDLNNLLELCSQILSDQPLFVLVNGYSAGYSAIAYENSLRFMVEKYGGRTEMGELTIEESKSGRLLPAGIFARISF